MTGRSSIDAAATWDAPEPELGSYFVSTYPPFSCWSPEATQELRRVLERPPAAPGSPPLGLYVHIPFCVARCTYCYYLTHDDRPGEVEAYLEALAGELRRYRLTPALAERPVSFVYFGGGTPSVLSVKRLRALVGALTEAASWTGAREVTFECAPRSVTEDKLRFLRDAGVTRLSLGVQQLDDAILAANGRVHVVRDVERAWRAIRRVGFDVVNLDLMAGLVRETDETFYRSLDRVIGMGPESVTIYQLEIPQNTRLYRSLEARALEERPAGWEVKRARLAGALSRLEAADYHVRSAYAAVRERRPFVYQDAQYRGADLLGIGVSAFSYLDGIGQQNLASLDAYLDACRRGELPLGRGYVLSGEERMVREFVLQLKLGGVERAYFQSKFGVDVLGHFREPLAEGRRRGWFALDEAGVAVTRNGLLRIDRLLPAFYRPEHRGVRYS